MSSTETAPRESDIAAGKADGSPPPEDARHGTTVDSSQGSEQSESDSGAGESPDTASNGSEGSGPSDDRDAQFAELGRLIVNDPVLYSRLMGEVRNEGREPMAAPSEPDDPFARGRKVLDERFQPEVAEALDQYMRKALEPELARMRELEPAAKKVGSWVSQSEFQGTLRVHGVNDQIAGSKEWQVHLKEMERDPEFRSLRAQSPSYAAKVAAKSFSAAQVVRQRNGNERERLALAKKAGTQAPRGANGAQRAGEKHTYPRGDIQALMRLVKAGARTSDIKPV